MSGLFGLLQVFILSIALVATVVALMVAFAYPRLQPRLRQVGPARRARLLTALAIAPLCISVMQTGLFFVPGFLGAIWPQMDHCLSHAASSHVHLCVVHPPHSAGALLGWLVVFAVLVGVARPLVKDLLRTWRSAQLVRQLVHTSEPGEDGLRIVPSQLPIAAATTIPAEVLVSSALVDTLPPGLLKAVVAHERAHLRRRDPWRLVAATVLSAGHFPGTRRMLLADLELACEQASDEEAARTVGDRVTVAQALVMVARMASESATPATALPFGDSSIEARVDALLAPPIPEGRLTTEIAWLATAAAVAIATADPGHHLAEHLIDLLVG